MQKMAKEFHKKDPDLVRGWCEGWKVCLEESGEPSSVVAVVEMVASRYLNEKHDEKNAREISGEVSIPVKGDDTFKSPDMSVAWAEKAVGKVIAETFCS